jgi:hypothetical protein
MAFPRPAAPIPRRRRLATAPDCHATPAVDVECGATVDLSSGPRQAILPGPAPCVPLAAHAAWSHPAAPSAPPPPAEHPPPLACRPIGRLQRDQVAILIYELSDRRTGRVRGYQSVVLSNSAAVHA